jgi:hypothetical protein
MQLLAPSTEFHLTSFGINQTASLQPVAPLQLTTPIPIRNGPPAVVDLTSEAIAKQTPSTAPARTSTGLDRNAPYVGNFLAEVVGSRSFDSSELQPATTAYLVREHLYANPSPIFITDDQPIKVEISNPVSASRSPDRKTVGYLSDSITVWLAPLMDGRKVKLHAQFKDAPKASSTSVDWTIVIHVLLLRNAITPYDRYIHILHVI